MVVLEVAAGQAVAKQPAVVGTPGTRSLAHQRQQLCAASMGLHAAGACMAACARIWCRPEAQGPAHPLTAVGSQTRPPPPAGQWEAGGSRAWLFYGYLASTLWLFYGYFVALSGLISGLLSGYFATILRLLIGFSLL